MTKDDLGYILEAGVFVYPPAAVNAGCIATISRTANVVNEWGDVYMAYTAQATAASGWRFVRWEQSYWYQHALADTHPGFQGMGNYSCQFTNAEWSGGSYVYAREGLEEWYIDYTGTSSEYVRPDIRRINSLTAVFARDPTNLILRSASSGAILHGAGDTILHDA